MRRMSAVDEDFVCLERMRRGEAGSQVAFWQRFEPVVRENLRAVANCQRNLTSTECDAIVDEAVAHALNQLITRPDYFDPAKNTVRGFLVFVAIRHAKDAFKRASKAVQKRVVDPGDEENNDIWEHINQPGQASPESEIVVWDAIDRLASSLYREVILLRYRGYTTDEIANVLRKTPEATETLIRRALDALYFSLYGQPRPRRGSSGGRPTRGGGQS